MSIVGRSFLPGRCCAFSDIPHPLALAAPEELELGKAMDPLEEALRVPATKVDGCASQVWIVPEIDGTGPQATFHFRGDSDAMIVRGLIAILRALYDGQSVQGVLDTDAGQALSQLGLDQHLSAQRSNGLRAMVTRINGLAGQAAVA